MRLSNLMDIKTGALPVKYLGVPLISTRLRIYDCKILVKKFMMKIKCWTNRWLSYTGRV